MEYEYKQLEDLVKRSPVLEHIIEDIKATFHIMAESYRCGGKLLICGNGGSAADSNHIVGELMKNFLKRRPFPGDLKKHLHKNSEWGQTLADGLEPPLPAIALTEHSSLSTAFANDANPELVYAQQLFGYGEKGDVFLGISTSGNSKNILYAAFLAKTMELKTIAFTGSQGGKLAELCNRSVKVPAKETHLVQELQLPIYHALCSMLEDEFFS